MMFETNTKVNVHVMQTGESYPCATNESLLQGMLRLGRKGIAVGCVNGGCGVCKVRIVEGRVRALGPISRAHVTAEEEALGYTLACRVAPTVAVRLEVAGRLAGWQAGRLAGWQAGRLAGWRSLFVGTQGSIGKTPSPHRRAPSSDFDTLIFLPFGRCPQLFLPHAAVNSTGLLNSASPSYNK